MRWCVSGLFFCRRAASASIAYTRVYAFNTNTHRENTQIYLYVDEDAMYIEIMRRERE